MFLKCIPLKPHFYVVKRVYRGIPNFLIFDPKHRLWVLVRAASATINVLNKIYSKYRIFPTKFSIFRLQLRKNLYILHGQVCVGEDNDPVTGDWSIIDHEYHFEPVCEKINNLGSDQV